MVPSPAATNRNASAVMPRIQFDEELWFGSANSDAFEAAAAQSMTATAGRVVGAKPFPAAARRLAELAKKESTKTDEFVRVLEQDSALSAKLLRMVNSAGFGLRQRCATVRHAVTLVGSNQLYKMATTAAVLDLFDSESGHAVQVLEHSAVVGAFCRYLGVHLSLPAEELFTAGVLHDIGKLMLLESLGSAYGDLLDQSEGRADTLHSTERAQQGFDHGVLAAHVLKEWNIPDPIPKVVAWHHEPTRAYASSSLHAALVQTLRIADALDHAMACGASQADIEAIARLDAADYLDISGAQLLTMVGELTSLRAKALAHTREQNEAGATYEAPGASSNQSASPKPVADVPRQFPCVCCGSPSFGVTCPACKGYICPEHPLSDAGWCALCAVEHQAYVTEHQLPARRPKAVVAATVLTVATTLMGAAHIVFDGMARGIAGGLLLSSLGLGAVWIIRRTQSRARFMRSQPDRSQSVPPLP